MSEPAPEPIYLFLSRSQRGNKMFRLHITDTHITLSPLGMYIAIYPELPADISWKKNYEKGNK
jgi:hypothetical protein